MSTSDGAGYFKGAELELFHPRRDTLSCDREA